MTKIIDNSKETLASALEKEFPEITDIAIASAYFNVRGFGALSKALDDKPLKLVLGKEPSDSIKWEDEVLRELEQNEDDANYFELLQNAISYFKSDKRQIRTLQGEFLHGKAYIGVHPSFENVKRGVGVVGSSNFTRGGLRYNKELNMLNTDREVVQELVSWFSDLWKNSADYKSAFMEMLEKYVTTASPYEVVAKALYETYKSIMDRPDDSQYIKSLSAHQVLSVREASLKLKQYGGVVIADSTGLGKTRVMIQLVHDAIREGRNPLLIAPKSVLNTTWDDEMNKLHIHINSINTEMLSANPDILTREYSSHDFIVIDEAHLFRSPSSNRYVALRDLILKNKAQVVLATATPVNTSLMDLYSLFSFYLTEESIIDLHGMTLRNYFISNQKKWLAGSTIDMDSVLRRFIVRVSRDLAKALDIDNKLKFPQRKLDEDACNRYEFKIDFTKIDDILSSMEFPYYDLSVERLSELKLPDGSPLPKELEERKQDLLKQLVKTVIIINLFKRLESSIEAFTSTANSLKEYILLAIEYAKDKQYFIPPKLRLDSLLQEEQLPTPEELFSKPKYKSMKDRCKFSSVETQQFIMECKNDLQKLNDLLAILPKSDRKYEQFERRVSALSEKMGDTNNGIVIFSQYAATAEYIYRRLASRFKKNRVMLVTGEICFNSDGEKVDKVRVVREFQKNGGLLVSTDVLSEGQNLQNAQFVANYDFPWNPVVLIQRIGRIDRIGSPYDDVFVINVLPKNGKPDDRSSLEYFLGLMDRLFRRLEAIRSTIGLDATTLGEQASPKDFNIQAALARNDMSQLNILAKELEQFTSDPRDMLARMINEMGLDWLKTLPLGIGAFKKSTKDGIFALFTDGTQFYWRLELFDKGEVMHSANDIVEMLLDGENNNKGNKIDYTKLIPMLVESKSNLRSELDTARKRQITSEGVPPTNRTIQAIYTKLAQSPEGGEKLAVRFRNQARCANVVKALEQAMKSGNLVEAAKKILTDSIPPQDKLPEEVKLKRICWCLLQKE